MSGFSILMLAAAPTPLLQHYAYIGVFTEGQTAGPWFLWITDGDKLHECFDSDLFNH